MTSTPTPEAHTALNIVYRAASTFHSTIESYLHLLDRVHTSVGSEWEYTTNNAAVGNRLSPAELTELAGYPALVEAARQAFGNVLPLVKLLAGDDADAVESHVATRYPHAARLAGWATSV